MDTVSFKEIALQEFDKEMATTRAVLARVPFAEKKDWRPHGKSMALGSLALHIARLSGMPKNIIGEDSQTFGGSAAMPGSDVADTDGLMAFFDANAKAARAALEGATDARFAGGWELTYNDGTNVREIYKGPRALAYRSLFMNHLIHHRAQLGVYLRLLDIPVPGSYGPSADER